MMMARLSRQTLVYMVLVVVVALFVLAASYQELEILSLAGRISTDNGILASYQLVPLKSSATSPSGLEVQLSILNTAFIKSGQSIALVVSMYNPTDSVLNVSKASNWSTEVMRDIGLSQPEPVASSGPCTSLPMGIVVLKGNLTTSELANGDWLMLFHPGLYNCPNMLFSDGYAFDPHSSNALPFSSTCTSEESCSMSKMAMTTATLAFSGYYVDSLSDVAGVNATFQTFEPGVYTIAGADEWGGLTVLHFVVA